MALGCLKRLSMRLSFGLLLPWSLRLSGSWSGSIHLPCLYVLFFFFWNLIRILQFQLAFFHKKEISSLRVCHRLNLSSLLLFSTMHAPFRCSWIATVIRNCGRFLLRSGLSLTFFVPDWDLWHIQRKLHCIFVRSSFEIRVVDWLIERNRSEMWSCGRDYFSGNKRHILYVSWNCFHLFSFEPLPTSLSWGQHTS